MSKSQSYDRHYQGAKILIVDDNSLNVELLESYLAPLGHEVITAYDGWHALDLAKTDPPDLVILDVLMPGMTGFEVCRRLKGTEETQLIPVILVTALTDRHSRIQGIEAGADDFISKPFDKAELLTRIASLLRMKALHDELDSVKNILFTLVLALEAKDRYTRGHSERVAELAAHLASRVGLSLADQEIIRTAAILHDIGKIGVDDAILNKAGPLIAEEMAHVREHAAIGERICQPLRFARPMLPIIRQHGERYDGTGYPDGLLGEEICLGARIVAVADAFDAMTSDRPYRSRLSTEDAIYMLREGAGQQWDPSLVGEFLDLISSNADQFSRGSEVNVWR